MKVPKKKRLFDEKKNTFEVDVTVRFLFFPSRASRTSSKFARPDFIFSLWGMKKIV